MAASRYPPPWAYSCTTSVYIRPGKLGKLFLCSVECSLHLASKHELGGEEPIRPWAVSELQQVWPKFFFSLDALDEQHFEVFHCRLCQQIEQRVVWAEGFEFLSLAELQELPAVELRPPIRHDLREVPKELPSSKENVPHGKCREES